MYDIAGTINAKNNCILLMLAAMDNSCKLKPITYQDDNFCFGMAAYVNNADNSKSYSRFDDKIIALSGNIYNRKELIAELTKSDDFTFTGNDAELILHCFCVMGPDVMQRLEGAFILAIWDIKEKSLFLARDKFGIKPLYYYFFDEVLIFASRLSGICNHPEFIKLFNEKMLLPYMCFGSPVKSETFFCNTFQIEPGAYVIYKNGTIHKESYYSLSFEPSNDNSCDITSEIHSAIVTSVKGCTDGVKCASFLSGGIDSSYIAAIAKPYITYTVGYDEKSFSESDFATRFSEEIGVNHSICRISSSQYLKTFKDAIKCLDEPIADPAATALYISACKMAEETYPPQVIISGEGADELFGGYNAYLECFRHTRYKKLPLFIRKILYLLTIPFPESKLKSFLRRNGCDLSKHNINSDRIFTDSDALKLLKCKSQPHSYDLTAECYKKYSNCSELCQKQAVDYYFKLTCDYITCVVRSTENVGIEARFPYLNTKVCEVAAKLTDEQKIKPTRTKHALRCAAHSVLPETVCNRKKVGFPVPLKQWMKEENFYNEIKNCFASKTAAKFFNCRHLEQLLASLQHGKEENYKKVLAIWTFIVWYDMYFSD